MEQEKKNELESRLRQMMKDGLRDENQSGQSEPPRAVCKVIRRRKGEKDKRIYVLE